MCVGRYATREGEAQLIAAVHITKTSAWKGHVEEWENVYHYDTPAITSEAGWDELIDKIVTAEKVFLPSTVGFVRARVHGPTDQTKDDDVMRRVRDLTGSGSASPTGSIPPELAVVCSIYMGRSPRGYKRFLRKYYHGAALAGAGVGSGQSYATAALSASMKSLFTNNLDPLRAFMIALGQCQLVTPDGVHIPTGEAWKVNDYISTRQFKRGRKERRG